MQVSSAARSVTVSVPTKPSLTTVRYLVGQFVEVEVQVGDISAVVDLAAQGEEPPGADGAGCDGHRMGRVVEVDVDDEHMTGIGFPCGRSW